MQDYILSCCSTADLSEAHFKARDIHYICFHYELDGVEYADDLGASMPFETFYQTMADGAETKTYQVNAEEFEAYFEGFLKQGKDILHVSLSSGLSGAINSATIAKGNLEKKYPDARILLVDSLGAYSGCGLLMDRLADLRDDGMAMTDVYDWEETHKLDVHHWFFSTDLTFYIKGWGRVSKTAGFIGGM
ncbi:DegV family protein, partial [Eubacterium aggregans]|uniref:DegV family protein n=1 Tax=Eubacterium aggregans TaxID=81409 RepID=UPI003F350047